MVVIAAGGQSRTLTENMSVPILVHMKEATALFYLIWCTLVLAVAAQAQPSTQQAQPEHGFASYYAGKFQGRLTANGEIFDTNGFTAAHKTLPFNTIVRVVNDETGAAVLVRINDRGPFVPGRIIDLSRAAADAIGMVGMGLAKVTVEVVDLGDGKTYHKTGPPSDRVILQIGAFRDEANAAKTVRLLESARLKPVIENGAGGFTKVLLPGVLAGDVKLILLKLDGLGFTDVLIRH